MKVFVITLLGALALFTSVAQAGNQSLCSKDGWMQAESANGAAFASLKDCAKAREVFLPSTSVTPQALQAGQYFSVEGRGFHASAQATLYIAVTGSAPYYSTATASDAAGSIALDRYFSACGSEYPYDLTLTLVDSFGVHASARVTLC